MPEKRTLERARKALQQGKSPSTAAGEFIREEFERIPRGKRGAASAKRAIAVGLAKARLAGVPLKPQKTTRARERTRLAMKKAYQAGKKRRRAKRATRRRRK